MNGQEIYTGMYVRKFSTQSWIATCTSITRDQDVVQRKRMMTQIEEKNAIAHYTDHIHIHSLIFLLTNV
jgi:hypothetical protein